eukprot:CAMPEP_0182573810 /NCGR_PEP_ID=MMETSP1324-20130603/20432_1 /TAXON_ID=236786 /ORGANISM="Florenciella sp., Strain RCC1587" /LENGTH=273 /DNA_ID=CAMNT_0024788967 /DNA_START=82 /DNA_END=903 /DNA_ORIENTATION=-
MSTPQTKKKDRSIKAEGGKKADILSPASRDFMGGQAPEAVKTPKSPHAKEGLPKIEEDKKPNSTTFLFVAAPMMVIVPAAIGIAIAFAIFTFGSTAKYEAKMALVAEYEMQYAYAAAAFVGAIVRLINLYPMRYKSAIMKTNSENLRSNMYVYKAIGPNAAQHHVVFDDEGDVGKYNRANRSLHHLTENHAIILVGAGLAGFVFPFPAMVCVLAWGAGRFLHQALYAASGYGAHAYGFMVAMNASLALEGLLMLTAAKGFGVPLPSLMAGPEL